MDGGRPTFDEDDILYGDLLAVDDVQEERRLVTAEDVAREAAEAAEAAVASSTIEEIDREEERRRRGEETEEPNVSTITLRSHAGYPRISKPEYFRSPAGLSKTVTFPVQHETIYYNTDVESVHDIDSHSSSPNDEESANVEPRTHGRPLKKLSLKIGQRVLHFSIIDAPRVPDDRQSVNVDWSEPSSSNWAPGPSSQMESRHQYPSAIDYASTSSASVPQQVVFICPTCDCRFDSKEQLLRHYQTHSAHKPYLCRMRDCAKTFASLQSLLLHEKHHDTEKPYRCPICQKTFTREYNYKTHLSVHASGRRHFCRICGKWFNTEVNLAVHQQNCESRMIGEVVPTDRPLRYKCLYCDKMFHHRRDKVVHERVHTGERPYSCGYCNKSFSQSQALTIHIRTHTGEKPYTCEVCGMSFRDTSALRKHEYTKHPNMRVPEGNFEETMETIILEDSGNAFGPTLGTAF